MENIGPTGKNSFESSSEDTTKPNAKKNKLSKKKLPIFGSSVEQSRNDSDKKDKAERDIAWAIDRFAWFDEKPLAAKKVTPNKINLETEAMAPSVEPDEEAIAKTPEDLSGSETQCLRQVIAQEHLEDIQDSEEPQKTGLWPAMNFLRQVSEGADTEAAFAEVATDIGLTEPEIQQALQPETTPPPPETHDILIDTSHDDQGEIDLGQRTPTAVPVAVRESTPVVQPQPEVMPDAAEDYYQRRKRRGNLLTVGLAAYLVGRRRGRIKTEKKLKPIQRRLERQVATLERDVTHKEQQLVALNADRVRTAERPLVERQAPMTVRVEQRPQLAVQLAERPVQSGRQETRLGLKKPEHAGRLGAVVLAIEAPRELLRRTQKVEAPAAVKSVERPHNIRQAFDTEYVQRMQRNELLELSEKIVVEGASLRHIYESHLVGEKQLRHLISEYLQGKDIRRSLRKEMVEHEIDFERDPILRDRVRSKVVNRGSAGLQELLARAGALPVDDKHAATIAVAERRRAAAEAKAAKRRHTADTVMATVIVVLALVVIALLVR